MPDKKVIVNKPIDWQDSWFLSEQSKSVYFEKDSDGNIKAMPVIVIDPSTSPVPARGKIAITGLDGSVNADTRQLTVITPDNVTAPTTYNAVKTISVPMLAKFGVGWEAQRTPSIFKTASLGAAGTIWDPAAGKIVRIMGLHIQIPANVTTAGAGVAYITLDAVAIFGFYIGATNTAQNIVIQFPGNGKLSTTVDNIVEFAPTAALTAGSIYFNLWGSEE